MFKHLYFVGSRDGDKIHKRKGAADMLNNFGEKTDVSRRNVYCDICNINDWLDSHNLPPLKIQRGK